MKTTLLCLLGGLLLAAPQTARCQFTFTTNNGALTVAGWAGSGTTVIIPATTNGMPVVGIGDRAFYRLTSLTSLTIPDTVTSIGSYTFSYCYGLTNVTIPNGVTSIGIWAFHYCSGLTNVTIPNSVTSIGDEAFAWCTSLTAIDVDPLNANFISMDGVLFNKDQTLLVQCPGGRKGSYTIPNSVASIGNSAFSSCAGLTNAPIPTNVTSIGSNAFTSCHGLTSVTILNSVTNIGSGAFSGCAGLADINADPLNADYSSVDGVLFNKEQTLLVQYPGGRTNSYTITNSVTSIGTAAFYGCLKLPSVTIPNSVTNIGNRAFMTCTSLTNVTTSSGVTSIGDFAFGGCFNLADMTIPNSVTSIGDYAFASCHGLTNMTIPNGVTRVGIAAFVDCTSLANVTIPNSVTSIEGGTFDRCSRLTGVTIGNGVTNIAYRAFLQCLRLPSVTIPSSVTSIENEAFLYCSKLKAAFFQGNAPVAGVNAFIGPTICYYLPGTSGWGSTYSGRPAYLWNPAPQTSGPSFGVGPNGFGFNITGTTNIPIVVEASANLAASDWLPLQTCTLTNGLIYFSDPAWKSFPTRHYRIRSP